MFGCADCFYFFFFFMVVFFSGWGGGVGMGGWVKRAAVALHSPDFEFISVDFFSSTFITLEVCFNHNKISHFITVEFHTL